MEDFCVPRMLISSYTFEIPIFTQDQNLSYCYHCRLFDLISCVNLCISDRDVNSIPSLGGYQRLRPVKLGIALRK